MKELLLKKKKPILWINILVALMLFSGGLYIIIVTQDILNCLFFFLGCVFYFFILRKDIVEKQNFIIVVNGVGIVADEYNFCIKWNQVLSVKYRISGFMYYKYLVLEIKYSSRSGKCTKSINIGNYHHNPKLLGEAIIYFSNRDIFKNCVASWFVFSVSKPPPPF